MFTDDFLEVIPCCAVVVFISRGQDLTVDGCQREGRVIKIELFTGVTHFDSLSRLLVATVDLICRQIKAVNERVVWC